MSEYWVTDQYFVGETIHIAEWAGAKFKGCEFLNCSIIGPGYLHASHFETKEFSSEASVMTDWGCEVLPAIGLFGDCVFWGSTFKEITWHPDFLKWIAP